MSSLESLINNFLTDGVTQQTWYKNIQDDLKAIILYGSVAKGTNRPDSDIDLLFILPLAVEEKYTTGEYFLNYRDQEFNIVMRSIEKLRDIAAGERDKFQTEIFTDSKIVWQKDEEVKDLIAKIQER